MRPFQLRRTVTIDEGKPIAVIVDLLMPRSAKFNKNVPPLMMGLAVQKIDGGEVAMTSYVETKIAGKMPDGRNNELQLRVASIPALLVMKGYAINGRDKHKDAYDIFFSVQNFDGGPAALAEACRHLLSDPIALTAFRYVAEKFKDVNSYGPATVRDFLIGHEALEDQTPAQLQNQVFFVVKEWIDALGIKP